MATIIMSQVTIGAPSFPCGGCLTVFCDWGDADLLATTSDILECCMKNDSIDGRDFKVLFGSSINIAATLTYLGIIGGIKTWTGDMGAVTFAYYGSADGTCSDAPLSTNPGTSLLTLTCDPVSGTSALTIVATDTVRVNSFTVFDSGSVNPQIDVSTDNANTVCIPEPAPSQTAGWSGSVIFELP